MKAVSIVSVIEPIARESKMFEINNRAASELFLNVLWRRFIHEPSGFSFVLMRLS
jgi:hypothetical protein